jgi:hypothetical protein
MLFWVPIASAQQTSAAGILQPVAGSTVVVKMIDAVDSSSDPAGKQYRATVTEPVNAGNNVIIGQGSAATVTLARNGSGWVAQLTSLVINGQSVAVTSGSAPVTSAAQNAVGDAANALRSVLGGLGRGANLPSGVAAVATGARVILPPGTSLSFVLGANPPPSAATPAASSAPLASAADTAPVAPAAQPPAAAAARQAGSAQAQAQKGRWWFCSAQTAGGSNVKKRYLSKVFFYPDDGITTETESLIIAAWRTHLGNNLMLSENLGTGCTLGGADQALTQRFHDAFTHEKGVDLIPVDWKYVPGQDTPPAYDSRIENYYCFAYFGQSNYASSVFAAPMHIDIGIMGKDFAQFVKEKYQSGEKVTGTCFEQGFDKAVTEAGKVQHEVSWTRQTGRKFIEVEWKPKTLPPPSKAHP